MKSIDSLRIEYSSQIKELKKIHNEELSDNCIFVGSGDSYVAGLMAEFITEHKCVCYSASDLLKSRFSKGKTYCFISASGKTKSNIIVARRATEAGVNTVAVTRYQNSMLAKACKTIIPVDMDDTRFSYAGFGSFTANVLTCLQVAGVTIPHKFGTWHNNGLKLSQKFLHSKTFPEKIDDTTILVLGNNTFYTLALYASLKITEFFGNLTVAHKLEEFCHSPIFGTRKSHHIWIFGQNELQISRNIEKTGSQVSYFELYNSDKVAQLFESIFLLQNLMLLLAEKYGITHEKYLLENDILKISSALIYMQ
jgi:fructoselysine-6-P-deglycase FrlB-like protein